MSSMEPSFEEAVQRLSNAGQFGRGVQLARASKEPLLDELRDKAQRIKGITRVSVSADDGTGSGYLAFGFDPREHLSMVLIDIHAEALEILGNNSEFQSEQSAVMSPLMVSIDEHCNVAVIRWWARQSEDVVPAITKSIIELLEQESVSTTE